MFNNLDIKVVAKLSSIIVGVGLVLYVIYAIFLKDLSIFQKNTKNSFITNIVPGFNEVLLVNTLNENASSYMEPGKVSTHMTNTKSLEFRVKDSLGSFIFPGNYYVTTFPSKITPKETRDTKLKRDIIYYINDKNITSIPATTRNEDINSVGHFSTYKVKNSFENNILSETLLFLSSTSDGSYKSTSTGKGIFSITNKFISEDDFYDFQKIFIGDKKTTVKAIEHSMFETSYLVKTIDKSRKNKAYNYYFYGFNKIDKPDNAYDFSGNTNKIDDTNLLSFLKDLSYEQFNITYENSSYDIGDTEFNSIINSIAKN